MLATSVWNSPSLWKVVERASIYLMMFLAVAMLVLPLVQVQEAAANPVGIGLSLIGIGLAIYAMLCHKCGASVGSGHLVTCYNDHNGTGWKQFYICQPDQKWHHGSCEQN